MTTGPSPAARWAARPPPPSCTTTGDPPSKYTSRVENYLRIRRNTVLPTPGRSLPRTAPSTPIRRSRRYLRHRLPLVTRQRHRSPRQSCRLRVFLSRRPYIIGTNQILQSELFLGGATVSFSPECRATEELTFGARNPYGSTRGVSRRSRWRWRRHNQAYALAYELSGATGLSRLTKVQEYGRNAVVAGDGTVTGMALPETTLSYSDPDAAASYDPGKTAFSSRIPNLQVT